MRGGWRCGGGSLSPETALAHFSYSSTSSWPSLRMTLKTHPFGGGSDGKESACSAGGAPGSILGSGRSPGEGNGNPLQYSCLENPMDREAWQATVHGVAKSRARLSG